jgi:NAD-dependent deacetylase
MSGDEEKLSALLNAASRIVAFTGAGISTESGIPDFRSPGGIWSRMKPIYFDDFVASEEARREDWERRFRSLRAFASAEPNEGHLALARLEAAGRLHALLTQNIDGLHARAGNDPSRIVELHGNGTYAGCLDCGSRHEIGWIEQRMEEEGAPPSCTACGGLLKAAVISFGQSLRRSDLERAEAAARAADLFLVLGSSLVVHPAASLPVLAKRSGAALAIVNRDPTPLDGVADLVIHASIGETMRQAVAPAPQ